VHTTASDGLLSPADLVERAKGIGLRAVAVTDHDTVAGLPEAVAAGRTHGVEVVPGMELTSYIGRTEVHVVGLFIDPYDGVAAERIEPYRLARRDRMAEMVRRLAALGVDVDVDEVHAEAPQGAVGRPHLARVLVRRGFACDESDAFVQYLRPDGPVYVKKREMSPVEAIALVRELGGLPVYAHPGVSRFDERVQGFRDAGLVGIEAWHPKHTRADVRHYARLAERRGLLVSGGSDFHGPGRSEMGLGELEIPATVLDALRERSRSSVERR
jgi:predicted metal-dependent phosphoesterase TrpH